MSPYILITKPAADDPEQEEPQLVAFVRGNFPAFDQPKSAHPAEYHLVKDVLLPKFEGLYEMVDGDLDKLMTQLMKPHFKKELLLNSVAEGTITLVAANGVDLSFHQGDNSVEGDWGWCSTSYGYTAEKPVETKTKKPGIFAGKSTVREKAAPPKEEIKAAVTPAITAGAVIQNYTTKKWKPQESYSRKEKRNAYKMRVGYCPEGWEEGVEIDVWFNTATNKLMTFSEVKALGPISLGVQQLAKNPPKAKGSDTETDRVDGTKELPAARETEAKATAEILPIMSPKTREAVNDIRRKDGYKKIISENADVINDPKQSQSYETKFADFAAQLGAKDMSEFAMWDYGMIHDLNKTNPSAVENMLWTFKNLCIKNNLFAKAEVKEEAPVTVKAKKPGIFSRASA